MNKICIKLSKNYKKPIYFKPKKLYNQDLPRPPTQHPHSPNLV